MVFRSLSFHTAKSLRHFTELYREGHTPSVVWDLTKCSTATYEYGRFNSVLGDSVSPSKIYEETA